MFQLERVTSLITTLEMAFMTPAVLPRTLAWPTRLHKAGSWLFYGLHLYPILLFSWCSCCKGFLIIPRRNKWALTSGFLSVRCLHLDVSIPGDQNYTLPHSSLCSDSPQRDGFPDHQNEHRMSPLVPSFA